MTVRAACERGTRLYSRRSSRRRRRPHRGFDAAFGSAPQAGGAVRRVQRSGAGAGAPSLSIGIKRSTGKNYKAFRKGLWGAAGLEFEPRLTDPESGVVRIKLGPSYDHLRYHLWVEVRGGS